MVNTRSSQGSQKRRRSTSPPEDRRDGKLQKTKLSRRRFTSADEQIHEEELEARVERDRSRQSTEQLEITQTTMSLQTAISETPIARSRRSLPPRPPIPVPAKVRTEPLRIVLAKEHERARRLSQGQLEHTEEEEEVDISYIDPNELDVDFHEFKTPARRPRSRLDLTPASNAVHSATPLLASAVKREGDIEVFECKIKALEQEKTDLLTQLHLHKLGVRTLGFGTLEGEEEDICKSIRKDFDDVRAKELDLLGEHLLDFDSLTNRDLLLLQPSVIASLLDENKGQQADLEDLDNKLAFVNAEYTGVTRALADSNERARSLERVGLQTEERLEIKIQEGVAQAERIADLAADLARVEDELEDKKTSIRQLQEDMAAAQAEHEATMDELRANHTNKIQGMEEELDQEHDYRLIAEDEISQKALEISELQIKYQKACDENEALKVANASTQANLDTVTAEKLQLETQLLEHEKKNEELSEKISKLEEQAEDLIVDIDAVQTQLTEAEEENRNLDEELKDAKETIEIHYVNLKTAQTEINQLRGDIFGAQEARNQLEKELTTSNENLELRNSEIRGLDIELAEKIANIENLQANLVALDEAMTELKKEKDTVINEKNVLLQARDDEIERRETEYHDMVTEKDGMIHQLGAEHRRELESRDHDIDLLRKENLAILATNATLSKTVAKRDAAVHQLLGINEKLVASAEEDMQSMQAWAERKQEQIGTARKVTQSVRISIAEQVPVVEEQHVEINGKKFRTSSTLRDSGYHGSDITVEEELIHEVSD